MIGIHGGANPAKTRQHDGPKVTEAFTKQQAGLAGSRAAWPQRARPSQDRLDSLERLSNYDVTSWDFPASVQWVLGPSPC